MACKDIEDKYTEKRKRNGEKSLRMEECSAQITNKKITLRQKMDSTSIVTRDEKWIVMNHTK